VRRKPGVICTPYPCTELNSMPSSLGNAKLNIFDNNRDISYSLTIPLYSLPISLKLQYRESPSTM
jgi:hypothetical protein